MIGQSLFGAEVFQLLRSNGHNVVGVFTIPDLNGKADPLGLLSFVLMCNAGFLSHCKFFLQLSTCSCVKQSTCS